MTLFTTETSVRLAHVESPLHGGILNAQCTILTCYMTIQAEAE